MSKYPWITFDLDLRKLPPQTLIQLGECYSKCDHLCRVPLKPKTSKEMHEIYLAKGAQATTAIEGNTLTEEEVKLRIEKKLELPPSKEYLGQEVDNIIKICNEIGNKVASGKIPKLTVSEICRYNKIILEKVPLSEHVIPGKFRKYTVGVGSYKAPDQSDVPALMDKLCKWLNSDNFDIFVDNPINNNIIKAIIAHLYLAWIHPFGDGNGRVARIVEFLILIGSGVPSPAAHLLSNHYNATRNEYYRQLDMSSKKNNATDFVAYAVQGLLDGLNEQLRWVFELIRAISWQNYIYEKLREEKYSRNRSKRIRTLILDLSTKPDPIPKNKLITMSENTVALYKDKNIMTLNRDIQELERLELIRKEEGGYRANTEIILGFLPRKAPS